MTAGQLLAVNGNTLTRIDTKPVRFAPWPELARNTCLFMCRYPLQELPVNSDFPDLTGLVLTDGFSRFSPRRKAEFIAGQRCAREALCAVTDIGTATSPHRGADGLPLWPQGTTGSISHSNGYAIAVAAQSSRYYALGIDIEMLQNEKEAIKIAALVLTQNELEKLPQDNKALAVTAAFSAKESLYKALYPHIYRFYDFHAAELTADFSNGTGLLKLTTDWSLHWPRKHEFTVYIHRTDKFVMSCVALPVSAMPTKAQYQTCESP